MNAMVSSFIRYLASDPTAVVSAALPGEDVEEVLFNIFGCRMETQGGKSTSYSVPETGIVCYLVI
jgi:hypothetical protein